MNRNSTTSPSWTTYSLPFDAEPAGFAGFGEGAEADEVIEMDDFGGDEAALEIGVDDAGGGGGFVAGVDGPGAGLLLAGGQVGAQAEEVIDGADEGADAALADAEAGEIFLRLGLGEVDEFALDLRGDYDGFGGQMGADVILHRLYVTRGGMDFCHCVLWQAAFLFLRGVDIRREVGEVGLGDVAGEDHGLGGEQEKAAGDLVLLIGESESGGGLSGVEVGEQFFADGHLGFGDLVAGADGFYQAIRAFLNGRSGRRGPVLS